MLTVASSGEGTDGLNAPTGMGKSLTYISAAALLGGRTIILTSTKGLQDQIRGEFNSISDIRGQTNFLCELEQPNKIYVDQAVCHLGIPCSLKGGGCTYYDAYRRAISARTVVTSYAYWLSIHAYGEGLGAFDFMVCDEAHNALDELGSHLSTRITDWEIDAFLHRERPGGGRSGWIRWSREQLVQLEPKLAAEILELQRRPQNRSLLRRIHDLKRVVKKLHEVQDIAESEERWVFNEDGGLNWTPVWPGRGSSALFQGIRKVLLVSATLTPKTMDLLGLRDYRYHEYPSTFPIRNRPIIHLVSGVRLKHTSTPLEIKAWMDKIDQIIQFRQDRKGLIHTVSYARRDYLMQNSRFRGLMISHDRRDTRARVEEFRRMRPPAILVSPSMDTGWDFKGDECRYQIIAKVPFPDSRSPVLAQRQQDDKEYGLHEAMITLVQAAGRPVRSETDWAETFIVDDNVSWFIYRHRKLAPRWFLEAYQPGVMVTPKPPPLR